MVELLGFLSSAMDLEERTTIRDIKAVHSDPLIDPPAINLFPYLCYESTRRLSAQC